jgi:hypothetical protein
LKEHRQGSEHRNASEDRYELDPGDAPAAREVVEWLAADGDADATRMPDHHDRRLEDNGKSDRHHGRNEGRTSQETPHQREVDENAEQRAADGRCNDSGEKRRTGQRRAAEKPRRMKNVGAYDRQLAVSEVDNAGCLVNDDDSGGEQRVGAAEGKNADK